MDASRVALVDWLSEDEGEEESVTTSLKKAESEVLGDQVGPFIGEPVSVGEIVFGGVLDVERVTRGVGDFVTEGQGEDVRLPPLPVVLVCDTDKLVVLVRGLDTLFDEDSVIWVVALEEEGPLSDERKGSEGGEVGEVLLEKVSIWLPVTPMLRVPLEDGVKVGKVEALNKSDDEPSTL